MKLVTRTQLAFTLLSLAAVGLTGLLAYQVAADSLKKEAISYVSSINLLKSSQIDDWLAGGLRELEMLAALPVIKDAMSEPRPARADSSAAQENPVDKVVGEYLLPVISHGFFIELFLMETTEGRVLASTEPVQSGKLMNSRVYFKKGMAGGHIGQVRYSMSVRKPTLVVAAPVRDAQGSVVGVLAGRLNLSDLSSIMQRTTGDWASEDSYLVNSQKFFITEPHFGANFMLRKTVSTFGVEQALSAGGKGYAAYEDYRNVEVLGAYNYLRNYRLAILTEVDMDELLAPARALRNGIYGITCIMVVIALVTGWMSASSILQPLQQLMQALAKVDIQNLRLQFDIQDKSEIGSLAGSFSSLLDTLHKTAVSRDLLQLEVQERRKVEEQLKLTMVQLQRSNQELEQFAYVASHDLQEPLRMVASYTQLLAEKYRNELDEKAQKYIGYAVDGAVRMQALIQDLLTYSRVTTRGDVMQPVELDKVMESVLSNLQLLVSRSGSRVTSDALPVVLGDYTQLVQLLQNLISNGIKFHDVEKSPVIHIRAEQDENGYRIAVRDNGIGIDQKYEAKVFTIFQRLHTREEYEGTGIGLALCKRIVERHGGKIWFESEPGQGTVFFFTLKPVNEGEQEPLPE